MNVTFMAAVPEEDLKEFASLIDVLVRTSCNSYECAKGRNRHLKLDPTKLCPWHQRLHNAAQKIETLLERKERT